ncbi:MAG: hypothetical protein ACI8RD_008824, partial [Bacillariaceae sp.]
ACNKEHVPTGVTRAYGFSKQNLAHHAGQLFVLVK